MRHILAGLQILSKYEDDTFCAEHDQIWAGPDYEAVSEEDRQAMANLGWFVDGDYFSAFT
jgi:hypothetical protein